MFSFLIGKDRLGNLYYQSRKGKRFVRYRGCADPTTISSEWYAWLHYMSDKAVENSRKLFCWERDRVKNMTGTPQACYPSGHLLGKPKKISVGQYRAWKP